MSASADKRIYLAGERALVTLVFDRDVYAVPTATLMGTVPALFGISRDTSKVVVLYSVMLDSFLRGPVVWTAVVEDRAMSIVATSGFSGASAPSFAGELGSCPGSARACGGTNACAPADTVIDFVAERKWHGRTSVFRAHATFVHAVSHVVGASVAGMPASTSVVGADVDVSYAFTGSEPAGPIAASVRVADNYGLQGVAVAYTGGSVPYYRERARCVRLRCGARLRTARVLCHVTGRVQFLRDPAWSRCRVPSPSCTPGTYASFAWC